MQGYSTYMTTMLEASHVNATGPIAETPFYSAAEAGGPQMACAAMIMSAVVRPNEIRPVDDGQYWQAVTGLEPDSRIANGNTSTFSRSLLTMHQRGLAVMMIGAVNLGGFASAGTEALPSGMAQVFADLDPLRLETERELAGELLAHLEAKNAYQERKVGLADIAGAVGWGWVVGLHTNGRLLQGAGGYSSHSLVVTRVDGGKIAAHNPGGNGIDALSDQVFDPDATTAILDDPTLIMSAVCKVLPARLPSTAV